MVEKDNFPQYRKYPNDRTYLKITSPTDFLQLDIIGHKYDLHEVHAIQYPEKQRIRDMILLVGGHWLLSSREEFEERLSYCKENLEPVH